MPREHTEPPTVDRLRADIDRGVTGDKIPASDPAAAPLGTDAEAGGAPPTRQERAMEEASRPTPQPAPPRKVGFPSWIIVLGLLAALALLIAMIAAA